MIKHYDPEKIELFNLIDDLSESNNLAEKNLEKVEELKQSFSKWLKK